jgi:hypothetical protein
MVSFGFSEAQVSLWGNMTRKLLILFFHSNTTARRVKGFDN